MKFLINHKFSILNPKWEQRITKNKHKQDTIQFALSIMKLVEERTNRTVNSVVGSKLVRSGASVNANYRSACRERSKARFIAKHGNSIARSR